MEQLENINRIVRKLEKLFYLYPAMRLGQLVENLANAAGRDVFYIRDDDLEKQIDIVTRWGWQPKGPEGDEG
jgi:hypothetical protein